MNINEYIAIVNDISSNFQGVGHAINSSTTGTDIKKDVAKIFLKRIKKTSRFLKLSKHKITRKVRKLK